MFGLLRLGIVKGALAIGSAGSLIYNFFLDDEQRKKIKEKTKPVWDSEVGRQLRQNVSNGIDRTIDQAKEVAHDVGEYFEEKGEQALNKGEQLLDEGKERVTELANNAVNQVTDTITGNNDGEDPDADEMGFWSRLMNTLGLSGKMAGMGVGLGLLFNKFFGKDKTGWDKFKFVFKLVTGLFLLGKVIELVSGKKNDAENNATPDANQDSQQRLDGPAAGPTNDFQNARGNRPQANNDAASPAAEADEEPAMLVSEADFQNGNTPNSTGLSGKLNGAANTPANHASDDGAPPTPKARPQYDELTADG